MQTQSLVGLRATDIVKLLVRYGAFMITSYNNPLAIVIPSEYTSKREFLQTMERIAEDIFDE